MSAAALTANPCTAVVLTAPGPGFAAQAGAATTLTGVATCPAGAVPEYQYWTKPVGAPNWTKITVTEQNPSGYLPGSFAWTPDTSGDWCVSVVTRAVGSAIGPDSFQARSNAVCGTDGRIPDALVIVVMAARNLGPGSPRPIRITRRGGPRGRGARDRSGRAPATRRSG